MPTFQPDARQRDAYRALFSALISDRQRLLNARAVVIDLRGNQGGSSDWSADLAAALWGEGRVDSAMASYFRGVQVWWRASRDNAAYVTDLLKWLREQKQTRSIEEVEPVAAALEKAITHGDAWVVEPIKAPAAAAGVDDTPPLDTPVYVIVPGQCASACLDALDTFTRFPNTRLIGAPSSADSAYLEVRTEAAPSGFSTVVIPIKMWVRRPRPVGASYRPKIEVKTLAWSTTDFVAAIEADLASAREN
jgi:hypothetical protein